MRLSSPLHNVLSFVYPRICIVCQNPLGHDKWLCDLCLKKLTTNHRLRDACPLCGQNRTLRRCTCEYHWNQPFESVFSLFDFDDTLRGIVYEFKYGGKKRLAFDMGAAYARLVPAEIFEGMDLAVCVPLFFWRAMKRGYNQAEHFAKGIIREAAQVEFLPNILVRKRSTKTQTRLSRSRRVANVAGVFTVHPGKRKLLRGKNIVIVDDIVTTCATTAECARALRDAGCGTIRVLSLARD